MSVEIGEDTRSIIVTLTGANLPRYAPFSIAASAGPSDKYSSLRITGSGVFFEKNGPVTLTTSATKDQTSVEVGATVDNIFINSLADLRNCLAWTLSRYGGPRHSITVRTTGINRLDENTSRAYATLRDFNKRAQSEGWSTILDFNAAYGATATVEDFNDEWDEISKSSFANQAFGNVIGARTFRDGMWFRVRTSEVSISSVSYTAENDTTVGDFNTWMLEQLEARGLPNTIASFNTLMADRKNVADFSAAPLTLED